MPRRREVPKREVLPDPKFGSQDVSKFINVIMQAGKKSVAERILYGAFDHISGKAGKDPIEVFQAAVNNVKPVVEVKSRRPAAWRCPCAGCVKPRASVPKNPWRNALRVNCWKLLKVAVPQ